MPGFLLLSPFLHYSSGCSITNASRASTADTRYVHDGISRERRERQRVEGSKSANERSDVCKNGLPFVSCVYSRTALTREYKRLMFIRDDEKREWYSSFFISTGVQSYVLMYMFDKRICICIQSIRAFKQNLYFLISHCNIREIKDCA